MSEESNPEADVKARIEQLMLEISQLRQRRKGSKEPKAKEILARQIADLQDQVAFLQRQLPEGGGQS